MAIQDMRQPIELDLLARRLAEAFADQPPTGAVVGRTMIRNAVADMLGCSELEAEQLVDSLVLRGKLAFVEVPETPGIWDFRVGAAPRR
jgi:hypothetical protein